MGRISGGLRVRQRERRLRLVSRACPVEGIGGWLAATLRDCCSRCGTGSPTSRGGVGGAAARGCVDPVEMFASNGGAVTTLALAPPYPKQRREAAGAHGLAPAGDRRGRHRLRPARPTVHRRRTAAALNAARPARCCPPAPAPGSGHPGCATAPAASAPASLFVRPFVADDLHECSLSDPALGSWIRPSDAAGVCSLLVGPRVRPDEGAVSPPLRRA